MKSKVLLIPVAGLALALPAITQATDATSANASPAPAATGSGWRERWQSMEDRLDQIFRDSVKGFGFEKPDAASAFGSTIDVREQGDAYVARVYLPKDDESNANITLKEGILKISTGKENAGNFEESITLPGPVQEEKMKVEHKEGLLVVTIPKAKAGSMAQGTTQMLPPPQDAWDRDIMREMQRMQDRMDQLSRDVFADLPVMGAGQFLNSTVKVDDQKNAYVVHFYVPDKDASNFKANLNDNQLEVTGSSESKSSNGNASQYSSGSYEEAITLPGPVQADKMKVDRKEGVVTVTLPKAG